MLIQKKNPVNYPIMKENWNKQGGGGSTPSAEQVIRNMKFFVPSGPAMCIKKIWQIVCEMRK